MTIRRVMLVDSWQNWPSSPLFAEALEELAGTCGWEWSVLDEARYLADDSKLTVRAAHRLHRRRPGAGSLNEAIMQRATDFRPDVVVVVKGANVTARTLEQVKGSTGATLVNFATDDPFNPRVSSRDLLEAISRYDLYVSTKRAVMDDVLGAGAQQVAYLPFAYKPTVHFPEDAKTAGERERFAADVAFVGGADEDRAPYFEALLDGIDGVRLALWGGYWSRHGRLGTHWRGMAVGRDYRLAVSSAAVVVNLVRRANRDGHVMRTFEVPACGGCMVNEWTREHEELFGDGVQTRFFTTPDELVSQVRDLLDHPADRSAMASEARRWVTGGRHTYADRLAQLVELAEGVR